MFDVQGSMLGVRGWMFDVPPRPFPVDAAIHPFPAQWRLNGTNLPGATSAGLELKNVRFEQAGAYSVVVSNAFGETTGSETELVIALLTIPDQPRSQSTFLGANLTLKRTVRLSVAIQRREHRRSHQQRLSAH